MPIFILSDSIEFPPAWLARSDGLLCVGGDLSSQRLIHAYENGIFPWYSENEPILWWSPDPRLVLFPHKIKISRSLRKKIKKKQFTITVNQDFPSTIFSCAQPRREVDEGTWLVEEMIQAYIRLHEKGFAHSVEAWSNGRLVGGLYGVCLGRSFFGESMFSRESDASKVALVTLAGYLESHGFDLIDCQVSSAHLINMGAEEISREAFLQLLNITMGRKPVPGIWDPSTLPCPVLTNTVSSS